MDSAANNPQSAPTAGRTAVTRALTRVCDGDAAAEGDLATLVYEDMRRLAAGLLRRERQGHTLQATALVHEAWVRLVDETSFAGKHATTARRRFLAHAVQSMRRILIDHARARLADKRSGDRERVPLTESMGSGVEETHELLDLDEALKELAERKPRPARIAELRIYGGLSTAEAADAVEVSLATAKVDWALAKARLTSRVRGLRTPE